MLPYCLIGIMINLASILIDKYVLVDSYEIIFIDIESVYADISAGPRGLSEPISIKSEAIRIMDKIKLNKHSENNDSFMN